MYELLIQLKSHAPPVYLQKVGKDEKYALTLRRWMIKFSKNPKAWEKCITPLLQILAKTEIPVDILTENKFGRHAKAMVDRAQEMKVGGLADIVDAFKKI